jgi:hypothetical protein
MQIFTFSFHKYCYFLTPQMPGVENFDLYENRDISQHMTSVDTLCELHSQDTYKGISKIIFEVHCGILCTICP